MATLKHARMGPDTTLRQMPNVGPATERDLHLLGIRRPAQLVGRDPQQLYRALERRTGRRQDPCVLDTFMAVVDFAEGAPARPWFRYTARRKSLQRAAQPSSR
jgi:hypothetical protein